MTILASLTVTLLALTVFAQPAKAEEHTLSFDRGLVSFGETIGMDALGEGNTASIGIEHNSADDSLTIPADTLKFPSRRFDHAGISGSVSFSVQGANLAGSWNPSLGRLVVRGPILLTIALDSGGTCQASTRLNFSTDNVNPFRAQRFTTGLEGPGAISANWSDLPSLTGAPECDFLSTLIQGPGGIWLSAGIEQPPGRPVSLSPPTLVGEGKGGARLTCTPGTWDGYNRMTYVWTRNGNPFDNFNPNGLARNTYDVVAADAGKEFACRQVVSNLQGETVGPDSNKLTIADPTAPINVSPPTLTDASGDQVSTIVPGDRVYCQSGQWERYSSLKTYWARDGETFENLRPNGQVSGDYRPTASDIGAEIVCGQIATNGGSSEVSAESSSALVVADPPVSISPPTLSGSPVVQSRLTCSEGEWQNRTGWAWEWTRDGEPFENLRPNGNSKNTYTTTPDDLGSVIACRQVAWNASGQVTGPDSNSFTIVLPPAPINVQPPAIFHGSSDRQISTLAAGQHLRCAASQWENATTIRRVWLRDGQEMPDVTGNTYKSEERETGSVIVCREIGENLFGAVIADSSPVTLTGPSTSPDAYDLSLPVMHINTEGRARILEKNRYLPAVTHLDPNGTDVKPYIGTLEIRGRGNTTWPLPKKPYKLKLSDKSEMLGMPASKNWELLANYLDHSNLRNSTAFYLAWQTSLSWSTRLRPVEVVLNGDYHGIYTLTEGVRVDPDRVNVQKMSTGDNAGSEVTGGYLLELDERLEANNEVGFRTGKDIPIVIKDPEDPTTPEQFAYIQNYLEEFEESLFADDFAQTRDYVNYIDVDSFIDAWLVNELTLNYDAHRSSLFFHKPRNGKLKMGPLWDFDRSMGNAGSRLNPPGGVENFRVRNLTPWLSRLWQDPEFVRRAGERWNLLKPRFDTVSNFLDKEGTEIAVAARSDAARWEYDPVPMETPEFLKSWLADRSAWMDSRMPKVTMPDPRPVVNEVNCTGTDWIELYNPTDTAIAIGGWVLTDDPLDRQPLRDSHRFTIPEGTVIPAGGYYVAPGWGDGIPFGISCDDTIILADQANEPIDSIQLDALSSGLRTYTRVPDGADSWAWRDPTPGKPLVLFQRPVNDNFKQAAEIVGEQVAVTGNSYGATREAGEPAHHIGSGSGSVWYRWVSPGAGTASVNTCSATGHDAAVSVYTGAQLDDLHRVGGTEHGCTDSAGGVSFEVSPGVTYFIAITIPVGSSQGPFGLNLGAELMPPPEAAPAITAAPAKVTTETSATFEFQSAEALNGFECRHDGGEFESCGSPVEYTDIGAGAHEFQVRAVNEAGQGPVARHVWSVVERGTDVPPGPSQSGRARITVLKISPKRQIIRKGRSSVVRVRVKNTGTAPAAGVRICVNTPKRITKVMGCAKVGRLVPGKARNLRFRVAVKSRATIGKKVVLRFKATARGAKPRHARAIVRVK